VHTHVMPGTNLYSGLYTGEFGIVYVEPDHDSGSYDQEVFLATHEFEPSTVPLRWKRKRPNQRTRRWKQK